MSELLDVFDDQMKPLGTATREDAHTNGLWHQTFHCWIIRKAEDRKTVLFQRRGPSKKDYPNALDITAAGHLLAGETREDGLRELNEELGVSPTVSDFRYLGIRMSSVRTGPRLNQEFAHVYLLEWGDDLSRYKLQSDEVSGIVEMEIQEGLAFFAGDVPAARVTGFQVGKSGVKQQVDIQIARQDVIPRIDSYYLKVFIMAERYFHGKHYLAI